MSDTVIRVENLGKRYRIGLKEKGVKSLKEQTKEVFTSPFKYLNTVLREPSPDEVFWALKDVSFEVKRGEVLGVIGRNGAGKSTLLKILSRITEPTKGFVEIRGRVGSLLEVGTGFHPDLTGRENTYLNGTIMGMKKREIDRRFDEIVDFAEVEKFIDTPVKHYSSGMYTRLAFAVAAHLTPEILIIDEVLAVGDSEFQKKCMGKMGDISKEGRTVLFVSHNITAVTKLCNSGIFLNQGRINMAGKVSDCIDNYMQSVNSNIESQWEGVDGNEKVKLYHFFAKQSECQNNNFLTDKKFTIFIKYEILKDISDLIIGIFILSSQGEKLAYTRIDDCVGDPVSYSSKGLHTVQLIIPANMFAQGEFLLNLDIGIHNKERIIDKSITLSLLNISGKGITYTTGRSFENIFRPDWDWLLHENMP